MRFRPDSVPRRYLRAGRMFRSLCPSHFSPWRSFFASAPVPLADLSAEDVTRANEASQKYFERESPRGYWLERPFSDPATAPRSLTRFGLLLDALRLLPGDRVLDFGCGSGWTSVFLARLGASVVGMDIAPAALDLARETARTLTGEAAARLSFEPFGGSDIAAPDGAFDTIFIFDAFHHFPNPAHLLAEFSRVLTPDGRLAFAEPGLGHAQAQGSISERRLGVLEMDLDLEALFQSGRAAGFFDLELFLPPLGPDVLTLPMKRARKFLRRRPGIVPLDYYRRAMLEGPLGILHKGPYHATSRNPRVLAARIRPAEDQVTARAGEIFFLEVEVRNEAETVWLKEMRRERGAVRLGAHLLDESGLRLEYDYGRAELPRNLAWGNRAKIKIQLSAPSRPGRFAVVLDMVSEGICWFADRGSPPARIRLDVI